MYAYVLCSVVHVARRVWVWWTLRSYDPQQTPRVSVQLLVSLATAARPVMHLKEHIRVACMLHTRDLFVEKMEGSGKSFMMLCWRRTQLTVITMMM